MRDDASMMSGYHGTMTRLDIEVEVENRDYEMVDA